MLNTRRPRGKRADLTTERVLAAAFEVLANEGLDGLTMRAIAKRLKVEGAALYWHFANKQALVDALAAAVLSKVEVPAAHSWESAAKTTLHRFRDALLSVRDGAKLVAGARLVESPLSVVQAKLHAALVVAGFSRKDALVAVVTLFDFALGSTFEEQADPTSSTRRGAKAMFDAGLSILLDGLRARLP